MQLEIGKRYRNEWGEEHLISGLTKHNPDWVYSSFGVWFNRHTGAQVSYSSLTAEHYELPVESNRTLCEEVK